MNAEKFKKNASIQDVGNQAFQIKPFMMDGIK
jgi:hypothetical protein